MDKSKVFKPKQILSDIGKLYPNAWRQVKMFRKGKGVNLPNWADWCYLPIAAGVAIATGGDNRLLPVIDKGISPAVITAAATWKLSQGVYRFDYDLYESLVNQPMDDELPCDVLKRLPEYCVYIETHTAKWAGSSIDGFFAHLEQDMNDFREELRFVFLLEDGRNIPFAVHLGNWTLEEGLEKMQKESHRQASIYSEIQLPYIDYSREILPFLQLVLYLSAENIDISKKPIHPRDKIKRSGVIDSVKAPKYWNVGQRIGSTIRRYRNTEVLRQGVGKKTDLENKKDGEEILKKKASPRPHLRRAHWHSFWKGPRDGNRELIVHWIPPTPIGVNKDDDHPIVIHPVK